MRALLGLLLLTTSCGAAPESGGTGDATPVVDSDESDTGASDDALSLDDAALDVDDPDSTPTSDSTPADTLLPESCGLAPSAAKTSWVYVDDGGKLAYKLSPRGDRIVDFSNAGYRGGGVAIPTVATTTTLKPSGGDDTKQIQAAIDALPVAGGAVALAAGDYTITGTISISKSNVVLRGAGSAKTNVTLTGSPRTAVTIGGTGNYATVGTPAKLTESYVPSGTRSFKVDSTKGLAKGSTVLIDRLVTAEWVHFMGMDTLVRDGKPQTWLDVGSKIRADRTVVDVTGDTVTIDAPLTDSYDAKYTTATIVPYTFSGRISEVGVEGIHFVAPKQTVPIDQPTFMLMEIGAVIDGWVHDVSGDEFMHGFTVAGSGKWITIEDSAVRRTAPIDNGAGYPFQYSVDGQQVLVQRCTASGNDVFSYVTQARSPGPNVVRAFTATSPHHLLQPHQRWSTGLLVDSVTTESNIEYINRNTDGSGHGWTIGWSVVWNSKAAALTIQTPPGSMNWGIGNTGAWTGDGIDDSPGKPVVSQSLYLAQLCERKGVAAVKSIEPSW